MSLPGKLIVIEGLEGSGKSTAISTLVKSLQQNDIKVETVREPGGTSIGETLRSILKNTEYKDRLDSRTELLILYAARVQLVEEVIKPALRQGIWIVADRFELSTFAYQGGGRGLDVQFIKRLSDFCLKDFKPDLTLFLDIEPELGMERARLRGEYDRIEQESMDFFHRIHKTYQQLAKTTGNLKRIDASAPLEVVQQEIKVIMDDYIKLHRNKA